MEIVDLLWNIFYYRKYKSCRDIVISDYLYFDLFLLLLIVDWDFLLRRKKLIFIYFIICDVFGVDDILVLYVWINFFYFKF